MLFRSEFDFVSNITTRPQFRLFRRGASNAVVFREPIEFNMYYSQFDYRLYFMSQQGENDALLAGFNGVLSQGPNLIGKASITLKAVISAQEIIDNDYTERFMKSYAHQMKMTEVKNAE